jgi:Holliday junction DNA helicase RuvA
MLSSLNPEEIQRAILSENVSTIQSVKGIGLKTAQRVIIELRDKVSLINEGSGFNVDFANSKREESLSALEVLGYSRKQTTKVVDKLISEISEITVEEIIKNALNKL